MIWRDVRHQLRQQQPGKVAAAVATAWLAALGLLSFSLFNTDWPALAPIVRGLRWLFLRLGAGPLTGISQSDVPRPATLGLMALLVLALGLIHWGNQQLTTAMLHIGGGSPPVPRQGWLQRLTGLAMLAVVGIWCGLVLALVGLQAADLNGGSESPLVQPWLGKLGLVLQWPLMWAWLSLGIVLGYRLSLGRFSQRLFLWPGAWLSSGGIGLLLALVSTLATGLRAAQTPYYGLLAWSLGVFLATASAWLILVGVALNVSWTRHHRGAGSRPEPPLAVTPPSFDSFTIRRRSD